VRSTQFAPPPAPVVAALRHPDAWVREVPGVRLSTRHVTELGGPAFQLVGIIDDTLPVRRIAETEGTKVTLSLEHVRHFDLSGAERWRALVSELGAKGQVTLAGCPPVVLRRFVDDLTLVGAAQLATVRLPATCGACHRVFWKTVKTEAVEAGLEKSPACPSCGKAMSVAESQPLLDALVRTVRELREKGPPAVVPEARVEPAPVKKPSPKPPVIDSGTEFFADKYEVLCKLAQGGMADVYLVRHHGAMGFRRVAVIKKVRSEFLTDDRLIRLFLEEAKAAARIDHPNVIHVYDLGRVKGDLFMVLEFVRGRSLSQVMKSVVAKGDVAPPVIAAAVVADLCKGLARAHQPDSTGQLLVHRDVTPGNVLVSFDGVVKLVDFGLAGAERMRHADDAVLGNPSWLAPEIYLEQAATPQTDIWGAGLVLLAMLVGRNPFWRPTLPATIQAILNDKVKRPLIKPWIPRQVFAVVERALEKNPEKRYREASSMAEDLTAACRKLGGGDVSKWIREAFAKEVERENEFARRCGAATFTDALLTSDAAQVERFYGGTTRG
jgi:tRNA A-37 threonylcarbamoyl transferase component Bud32